MKSPQKNILLTAAITSLILIYILTMISPSIRMVLSLLIILFFPGYGITAILFTRSALDLPARLLLSVGLSLVLTALSGLILNLTPLGLALHNPWLVLSVGGTGLVGLLFLIRDILNLNETTILPRIGFHSRQLLFLALAAAIAAIAVNLARTPVSPKNLNGYTLFWIQPESVAGRLMLGVRSEEFQTTKYQLHIEMNEIQRQGPTFELKPGETWEYSLELDEKTLTGQPVTLSLYRLDKPDEVYRRLVWWNENN